MGNVDDLFINLRVLFILIDIMFLVGLSFFLVAICRFDALEKLATIETTLCMDAQNKSLKWTITNY